MGKPNNKKTKKKLSLKYRIVLYSLSILLLLTIIGGYFFIDYVLSGIPSFEKLENPETQLSSKVYTADGEVLTHFYIKNRIETQIDSIPKDLINALIATEDIKFYEHWGVNSARFIKGLVKTVFMGKREGGSTITMQLAKNLFGYKSGSEKFYETAVRKIREWITAVELEKAYTKNEILEMYLNTTFFGERTYGVNMAAKAYFNKNLEELTTPECAVLVALCKSSYYYNPYKFYDRAFRRRNQVLYNMAVNGYLTAEKYKEYKELPIDIPEERISDSFEHSIAPYYVEYIRQKLEELGSKKGFNIHEDGLSIYTTLDSRLQKIANRAVKNHLEKFQKNFDKYWKWSKNKRLLNDILERAVKAKHQYWRYQTEEERKEYMRKMTSNPIFVDSVKQVAQTIEAGLVVIDIKTGYIKAMVGGRDIENGRGLNHVTSISRQPGSCFKPFVYIAALQNGLYPAYPILNQKFEIDGWIPENFSHTYSGFMTLREGLKKSKNIVAARLLVEGHAEKYQVAQVAKKMGISSRIRPYWSMSLGVSEVNPLEITSAYATMANKGFYNSPIALTEIVDNDGLVLETFLPKTEEAISEATAFLITNMLQSVVDEGTGLRVRNYYRGTAAGKTGTTQEAADAWFVGYTPELAVGVWVGFDKSREINFQCMGDIQGQASRAALPIWAEFIKEAYDSLKISSGEFEQPSDVALVDFCEESITELGDPRLYSDECHSGNYYDFINVNNANIPLFNARRDTTVRIFDKYLWIDSLSHEAKEIKPDDPLYYN